MRQKARSTILIMVLAVAAFLAVQAQAGERYPSRTIATIRGEINFGGNSGETTTFTRLYPDGSTAPFSLPSNKVFVVTDVEWLARSGAEKTILLYLKLNNLAIYEGIMKIQGAAGPGPDIYAKSSDHLSAGFVINSPNDLKAEAHADNGAWMWVDLRGYFSPK